MGRKEEKKRQKEKTDTPPAATYSQEQLVLTATVPAAKDILLQPLPTHHLAR